MVSSCLCLTGWTGWILDIYTVFPIIKSPNPHWKQAVPTKNFFFSVCINEILLGIFCIWYSSDRYLQCIDGSTSKLEFFKSICLPRIKLWMSSCLCRACPWPAWWAQPADSSPALRKTSDCDPPPAEPAGQSCKQMTSVKDYVGTGRVLVHKTSDCAPPTAERAGQSCKQIAKFF